MKRFKDVEHLLRLAGLFVAGVLVFSVARAELVPATFGTLGHYRASAIDDVRATPLVHAGQAACAVCHTDVVDLRWSALIPPHRFTLAAMAPLATELLALRRPDLVDHWAAHPRVGSVVALNIAAVVGRRLQVFQAMWLREMQRSVSQAHA